MYIGDTAERGLITELEQPADPADPAALAALPGVTNAERHGEAVILTCADSDLTLRALLSRFPAARDIEVAGAGIEEAFMALTADDNDDELEKVR